MSPNILHQNYLDTLQSFEVFIGTERMSLIVYQFIHPLNYFANAIIKGYIIIYSNWIDFNIDAGTCLSGGGYDEDKSPGHFTNLDLCRNQARPSMKGMIN